MSFFIVALLLSIPHLFYAFVWTRSKDFKELCNTYFPGQDYVSLFSKAAYLIKIVQFLTYLVYLLSLGPLQLGEITIVRFIIASALFGFGQYLNAGIYSAIGVDGVYYGCRLGKEVPWHDGFPFNVCPHPQYVGSVISIWGISVLLWNADHHTPLLWVSILMTFYYAITSYIEDRM